MGSSSCATVYPPIPEDFASSRCFCEETLSPSFAVGVTANPVSALGVPATFAAAHPDSNPRAIPSRLFFRHQVFPAEPYGDGQGEKPHFFRPQIRIRLNA